MTMPSENRSRDPFHLTNLQVIVILLVVGAVLVGGTWIVAEEFGRVPFSFWDICTSVLPGTDDKVPAVPVKP